tara:strand:+ start:12387 stop:12938 length:552 start_codon:yes stop_codon:yes gene_type:complete
MNFEGINQRGSKKMYVEGNSRAAVIVPLILGEDGEEILFTKRTTWLDEHAGQMSFPGGRYEQEDKVLKRTAIREAMEEIGIEFNEMKFIGELDECSTITKYTITPFIVEIPDRSYTRNKKEVAKIMRYSVEDLTSVSNFEWKEHTNSNETILLPYFYMEDEVIWGATARILVQLLETTTGWRS